MARNETRGSLYVSLLAAPHKTDLAAEKRMVIAAAGLGRSGLFQDT